MALTEGGNDMVMPVSPMYGNGSNGIFGDGSIWLIILFLFAIMSGGWGNGFGGGNTPVQQVNNDMQHGFDQQSIMNGISGINNGLSAAEVSRCNNQANILLALNNMASNFQQCCCENREQVADLKYSVATEAANTRSATQSGDQMIMDKLCQLEMDGMKQNYESQIRGMQSQIDALTSSLGTANNRAFITSEVARILQDNAAQTMALEQYLNPNPIPAYVVQNPNGYTASFNRCGMNI